jgi:hypothetical protein
MPINNQKMIQSVYDTLFSGYVQPPDAAKVQGGNPQPDRVYLCLEWPGKQVAESDLANAWSPTNPSGVMSANEKFSSLVDDIPSVFPMFSPIGPKVSEQYRAIANAQVTPPPENAAQKAAYEKADALLWKDSPDYDDNGKSITVKKPHPMYVAYKKAALAYTSALTTFLTNYLALDMSNPADQRKFATLGPGWRAPVDAAWDDWTAAHKTRIEDALATIAQSSNNQVGVVFSEAKKRLSDLKKAGLSEPAKIWYGTYASPANWFAPSAVDSWTNATISSEKYVKNEHSDYSEIKVDGKASWGLWSGGGGFSKSDAHEHMDETTDGLEVSFSYAKVDIDRPWLNAVLMGLQGWHTTAAKKNGYSNGTKDQTNVQQFPLLPVSFVAVRNLSITAKWGQKDLDSITKKMGANASFGWGPFSVNSSYASGSSDKNFKSEFDGRTITNKGLQIIAWICAVNPACPPEDMPSA